MVGSVTMSTWWITPFTVTSMTCTWTFTPTCNCGVINDPNIIMGLNSRLFSMAVSREKITEKPK